MGMQYCARAPRPRDGDVQARFGRGFSRSRHDVAVLVDLDDLTGCEEALVDAADGDGETEGIAAQDRAEVTARPQGPAAGVTLAPDLDELGGQVGDRKSTRLNSSHVAI